jgi:hypothetical protein
VNEVVGATLDQEQQGPRKPHERAACTRRPLTLADMEDGIEIPAYKHGKLKLLLSCCTSPLGMTCSLELARQPTFETVANGPRLGGNS